MQKTLILTVGLPRSGKSTWAQKQDCPIVNPDSIRLSIHGQPFLKEIEPLVWAIAKIMVQSLFLAGHIKVILDATNVTKERRVFWESDLYLTKFKIFRTSEKECIRRAIKDKKDYLIPVIKDMELKWENPKYD